MENKEKSMKFICLFLMFNYFLLLFVFEILQKKPAAALRKKNFFILNCSLISQLFPLRKCSFFHTHYLLIAENGGKSTKWKVFQFGFILHPLFVLRGLHNDVLFHFNFFAWNFRFDKVFIAFCSSLSSMEMLF